MLTLQYNVVAAYSLILFFFFMMTVLLYITSLLLFTWIFYAIGIRHLGLIPVFIIIGIILIYSKDYRYVSVKHRERKKYTIYTAWLLMLAWFVWMASFFMESTVHIGLWIITINIIFWLLSYIINYRDGTSMGQLWYYAALLYILRQASYGLDRHGLRQAVSLFWLLTLALVAFVVGVIGHWRTVQTYLWYQLFILSGWAILIAISNYIIDSYTVLLVDSLLVLGLSIGLYWIDNYHIPTDHEIKTISVRRILAGERINKNKNILHNNSIIHKLSVWVSAMPPWTRYAIEWINCALVIITIGLYLSNIGQAVSQRHQWIYWIIIVLFITTALILKRIGFTSVMQKITLFAVINYAIYLTLYTIFDGSVGAIAGRGIVWNIISSIVLFYAPSSFLSETLKQVDYWYWIIMTIGAFFINIYLLW
jgi:hypothetical protein